MIQGRGDFHLRLGGATPPLISVQLWRRGWSVDETLHVRIFRQHAARLSFCVLNLFVHMQTDINQSCPACIVAVPALLSAVFL